MNKISGLFTLSIVFLASSAQAGTMGPISTQDWIWVGAISAGAAWGNSGTTQTINLTPDIEKTYTADKSSKAFFDGEVFLGMQTALSQIIQGQLGVAVGVTSDAKLNGEIWDDADPEFNNFTYSYKLQHTHIAVKGKLLADIDFILMPWVSASLGVGFNDAYGFRSTPVIFEALSTPDFSSHVETSFTYTFGAGIQKALNNNWQVGIGYEFADWGRSRLGRAEGQTSSSHLSLNHFYTNGVLFNLTYLA
ncbi:outer membrane protein [Legionella longbeachae]|uniref:outer membrane protein n=1 Tax=Legionella longbeachae TaxID=450 RepID=UPI0012455B06|nr:porin family protein [Legionella longbeachae]QEY51383.1 porin family protein [Legionella longbeachae]